MSWPVSWATIASVADDVLSDRTLNRTTLRRQLLLERVAMDPVAAVDHLVGMQAQVPNDPYTALWSRLAPFDPSMLGDALLDRRLVRTWTLRGTIHLVSAADCLGTRSLFQPVLDADMANHRDAAPALAGVELQPVLAHAESLLGADASPLSGTELRAAMAQRFPDLDGPAISHACRCLVPLVQAPPRGVWGRTSQVRLATVRSWLGAPVTTAAPARRLDDLVLRYLAAFGPATPADASTWTRLPGMREVFERLRGRLRTYRDAKGRELFDLADERGVVVDPDVPAPVRFLPEYDNVLLSHDDRSRFADRAAVGPLYPDLNPGRGQVLHDGALRATWKLQRSRDAVTMTVLHLKLPKRAVASIEAEARRLLKFLAADTPTRDIALVEVG